MKNGIANAVGGELEVLEFTVGDYRCGINIAKITEIMPETVLMPLPNAPEELEGVFIPRDELISVIDLHKVLDCERRQDKKSIFIICRFNNLSVAFRVTSVAGIRRFSFSEITEPPIAASEKDIAARFTGAAKTADGVILMLDPERIVCDINRVNALDTSGVEDIPKLSAAAGRRRIVLAEDSAVLRTMLKKLLKDVGFENISAFANGREAWDYISSAASSEDIGCVVSDIEMPLLDGFGLAGLIKGNDATRRIPVIFFSSLIDEATAEKCTAIGDAYFAKPQAAQLVKKVIGIIK